jgi:hypothetical protein
VRWLLVVWCLLVAGVLCVAQSEHVNAFWQTRDSNYNNSLYVSGGGAAYTGPLDINGSAYAFWSTRCGGSVYTGNVADIWDGSTGSTTETLITCSSGGVLNQTVNALSVTCAVSCRIKTLYDQSGSANCSGACNVTQATNADRPSVTVNCQNGLICMVCNAATPTNLVSASTISNAQAQALTVSYVAERTGNTSAYNSVIGASGGNLQLGFNNAANALFMYAAGSIPSNIVANDNVLHAVQNIVNGASSAWYLDGSSTTVSTSPGSTGIAASNAIDLCDGAGSDPTTGEVFEVGVWSGDKTTNNATMNSNQHTYWNF